jgi:drug/metabolite transporter (DMT)-like permease
MAFPATSTHPAGSYAGYALAAAGAIMFASKGVLIKLAYAEGVDALTLLALRMLFSAPVFIAVGIWASRRPGAPVRAPLGWRGLAAGLGTGLLGYWYASYADFKGLETLSPEFERLILFTYPFFVVLIGAAFFRHPLRARSVGAFALSYAGLAVVFLTDYRSQGPAVITGSLWVLTSALAFAVYQLLAKPLIGRMGSALFTAIGMSGAALGIFVHFALTHPLSALVVPPDALAAALAVAVLATVVPTYLMNAALSKISAAANSTIGTLSPVATLVLAAAVLGETISLADVLGTTLVLAGVGLYTVLDRRG